MIERKEVDTYLGLVNTRVIVMRERASAGAGTGVGPGHVIEKGIFGGTMVSLTSIIKEGIVLTCDDFDAGCVAFADHVSVLGAIAALAGQNVGHRLTSNRYHQNAGCASRSQCSLVCPPLRSLNMLLGRTNLHETIPGGPKKVGAFCSNRVPSPFEHLCETSVIHRAFGKQN
jgi:hypothetical protein